MLHKFKVEVEIEESSHAEVKTFILNAIECWGGQLHPDHPFFNLRDKVKVTTYRK